MSKRQYQQLNRQYRRNNQLFPDNGFSIRPWEVPLKEKIRQEIAAGLDTGSEWAKTAARNWHIDLATGKFREF